MTINIKATGIPDGTLLRVDQIKARDGSRAVISESSDVPPGGEIAVALPEGTEVSLTIHRPPVPVSPPHDFAPDAPEAPGE